MAPLSDDPFLAEVLGLFAQEAREWLGQLQGAILQVEVIAEGGKRAEALATIQRALTNLGGSAATVEQPGIEQLAFALLPLAQGLDAEGSPAAAARLAALKEGVGAVGRAIDRLAEGGTVPAADLVPVLHRIAETAAGRGEPIGSPPPRLDAPVAAGGDLSEPVQFRRLDDWRLRDQPLLSGLQASLPAVEEVLTGFKQGGVGNAAGRDRAGAIVEDLTRLEATAAAAGATAIRTLLNGLRAFIGIAAGGRVPILRQRFEAVEAKVGTLLPLAETWARTASDTGTSSAATKSQV